MAASRLTLRPVRPADFDRVSELCADIWEGHDYIPAVFDRWINDPSASFEAAELDGLLVGLQRTRPISRRAVWYEGLRVASTHRRQGFANEMVVAALQQARDSGFEEVRLASFEPDARRLFERLGFKQKVEAVNWEAGRVEGGETAAIPSPSDAGRLMEALRADPALAAYGGLNMDPEAALDIDVPELERLAGAGRLRTGAGGRALAAVRPTWRRERIWVTFLSGSGAALQDLLLALRYEADADGLEGVLVAAPRDHPAATDLEAVAYDGRTQPFSWAVYALDLQSWPGAT